MAMTSDEIQSLLREAFPDGHVVVTPLADDGDHFAARVISKQFEGLSRVKQHQLVYSALQGRMGGVLHALALETSIPK